MSVSLLGPHRTRSTGSKGPTKIRHRRVPAKLGANQLMPSQPRDGRPRCTVRIAAGIDPLRDSDGSAACLKIRGRLCGR